MHSETYLISMSEFRYDITTSVLFSTTTSVLSTSVLLLVYYVLCLKMQYYTYKCNIIPTNHNAISRQNHITSRISLFQNHITSTAWLSSTSVDSFFVLSFSASFSATNAYKPSSGDSVSVSFSVSFSVSSTVVVIV
jgi:hypothetical protein